MKTKYFFPSFSFVTFSLLCLSLLITSCSKEGISVLNEDNNVTSLEMVSSTSSSSSESFNVTPAMVSRYVFFASKERNVDCIEPIVNIDTLAYYVQYSNNGGWDLISADTRMTPLLVSSPDGTLYGSDSFIRDLALETVNSVKVVKQSSESKIKNIWAYIKRSNETKAKNHQTNYLNRGIAQGMWIPIDTTFAFDTTTSNRIISTKWGQRDPWDRYTPLDPNYFNTHSAVGGLPVAVGQIMYRYLYLTNGLYNIPDSVYFDVEPHFVSYTTDWSGFAETSQNTNDSAKNKTAKFLSWIGHITNTDYHYSSSESNINAALFWFLQFFHFTYSSIYNPNLVYSNLSNSIPVFISASNASNTVTHSFIIDAYKVIRYQMIVNYEFDPYYNVTEDDLLNNPQWMFEWPSPIQFPSYDPEKEPAIMPVPTELFNTLFFMMNWGQDGVGDEVAFSSSSLNWTCDTTTYVTPNMIFYNITRK